MTVMQSDHPAAAGGHLDVVRRDEQCQAVGDRAGDLRCSAKPSEAGSAAPATPAIRPAAAGSATGMLAIPWYWLSVMPPKMPDRKLSCTRPRRHSSADRAVDRTNAPAQL